MSAILIVNTNVSSAQVSILPATAPHDGFGHPPFDNSTHEIALIWTSNVGNPVSGYVIAGAMNIGIAITDGTQTYFETWANLGYPGAVTDPDIVLLQDGHKAVVSFEYQNNVILVELDIDATTLQPTPAGLNNPILAFANFKQAHIDSDPINDRFAVTWNDNGQIKYSVYDFTGGQYNFMSAYNQQIATFPNPVTNPVQSYPDIALSFNPGTQEPWTLVSYYQTQTGTSNYIMYLDESINPGAVNNILTEVTQMPTSYTLQQINKQRIAGENETAGVQGTHMKWALSFNEMNPTFTNLSTPQVRYINSDYIYNFNGNAMFWLDDPMGTNIFRSEAPALDWTANSNDAFVAFRTQRFVTGSGATDHIVGVYTPFFTPAPNYNAWEEVELVPPVGATTSYGGHNSVSVCSDMNTQLYVVSYWIEGKLLYKLPSMPTTGFKPTNLHLNQERQIDLFPNPSVGTLNLNSTNNELVTIYDTKGQKVKSLNIKANEPLQVDISSFPNGLYMLKTNAQSIPFSVTK